APAAAWKEVEASCFNWKIVMENLQEGGSWDQNSLSPRLPHCLSAKRDQNVKLDFGPPIATLWAVHACPFRPRLNGARIFRHHRGSAAFGAGAARLRRELVQSDGAAWRHRAVTRRQDG